ncbi:MAG: energy transducer TonB [Epsilonproteobacteria bacterium]|nr:energy transducer TonB [Campylobacterota bacterium]
MQRHGPRLFTAYMITAVAYLLVVLFIYYTQSHHFVSSQEPKESVIKMSLSQFVPEVVTPPEPVIEKVEEPVEEKAVEEPEVEPEPVIEKEVVKEVVLEPIVEKVTPKVVKKPAKKKLVKKKVQKKIKTKKKKKKKKKTSHKQASKQQNHSSKAEKNKFWNALRRKIDNHKFYPRIAKKRGMEGTVKVKFTILANGRVGNITVKGPKIFHHSAKNAVKSAFPINARKVPISLPTSINITLRYQMR